MRARLSVAVDFAQFSGIHLLPPHEHLTTALRTIEAPSAGLHASFAWLGHGAMIRRSEAISFLSLLDHLNVSYDERQMADNYFTLLSNENAEVWLDQGIELGGGEAFTVGSAGNERNNRHIVCFTRMSLLDAHTLTLCRCALLNTWILCCVVRLIAVLHMEVMSAPRSACLKFSAKRHRK